MNKLDKTVMKSCVIVAMFFITIPYVLIVVFKMAFEKAYLGLEVAEEYVENIFD